MNKETKIKIKKIIDEYVGFAQQVPTLEPNDLSLEKVVEEIIQVLKAD